ncbi:MAG: sulfatase/phosphatase domain-containing protein [Planctomycetota bacterium]
MGGEHARPAADPGARRLAARGRGIGPRRSDRHLPDARRPLRPRRRHAQERSRPSPRRALAPPAARGSGRGTLGRPAGGAHDAPRGRGRDAGALGEDENRAARQHWSIRTERYRYVRYNSGAIELYDHADDPNEWHNLAGEPAHAPAVARLDALLREMIRPIELAPIGGPRPRE